MSFQLLNYIISYLVPPLCIHCHREGAWLCPLAREKLAAEPVYPEQITLPNIDRVFIRGSYDCTVLQQFVHKLKYSYWSASATDITEILSPLVPILRGFPADTVIVPVPLHARRLKERGFNQAMLIAEALGQIIGLPVAPILQRRRYTRPQAQLSEKQRVENVADVFAKINRLEQIPSSVILVDDVLTTGSTLMACAKILRQQGVRQLSVCTLAKG